MTVVTGGTLKSTRPAIVSAIHSGPLNGICCAVISALTASRTAPKCAADPMPTVE